MAKHFQDITRAHMKNDGKSAVHLLMPEQNLTLCGQIKTHERIEDHTVQRLWEVDKPITCRRCINLLIGVVREQMKYLTASQLESLLDVIIKHRKANSGTRQNEQS